MWPRHLEVAATTKHFLLAITHLQTAQRTKNHGRNKDMKLKRRSTRYGNSLWVHEQDVQCAPPSRTVAGGDGEVGSGRHRDRHGELRRLAVEPPHPRPRLIAPLLVRPLVDEMPERLLRGGVMCPRRPLRQPQVGAKNEAVLLLPPRFLLLLVFLGLTDAVRRRRAVAVPGGGDEQRRGARLLRRLHRPELLELPLPRGLLLPVPLARAVGEEGALADLLAVGVVPLVRVVVGRRRRRRRVRVGGLEVEEVEGAHRHLRLRVMVRGAVGRVVRHGGGRAVVGRRLGRGGGGGGGACGGGGRRRRGQGHFHRLS
jgi:hypothetical protein|uniref:Uncharacterized protein n=1 Tax=Zea mays TaxID=4577 RepID=A0A804PQQ1_MAIZE